MSTGARPRVVIAGAGALGSLVGGLLAERGLPVTLLARRDELPTAVAEQGGLRIVGHGGDRIVALRATARPDEIVDADIVVFLCKAMSTREVARAVAHLFRRDETIAVSFQNGLGNEQEVAAIVGEGRVLGGLTALGARLEAPGTVRAFADLPSHVGELEGGVSARATAVADAFTRHGVFTSCCADIRRMKWIKLFANVAFSATSGATGLSIAGVVALPTLRLVALRALDEAAAVAAASGVVVDDAERRQVFDSVSDPQGAGANTTSMFRDLLAGRPTEVEWIYGSVIALGMRHGVPTPTLEALAAIIRGREAANASRAI